jgi:hypothetical protein
MLRDYIEWGGLVKRAGKTLLFRINRHRAWQIAKECPNRVGLPKLVNPESGKVHNVSPHRLRDAFAVHTAYAEDAVAWENEARIRAGKPIYSPEEYAERVDWHLRRIPYKLVKCR